MGDESLYQVVVELEVSERKYHEQLSYLSDLYILHLKTCVTSGEELERMLLTKIRDVIDVSESLQDKLKGRLEEWSDEESQVGDVFLDAVDLWDIYRYFCTNVDSAIRKYDEKMAAPDFAALVSLKQGLNNASLKELILLPIRQLKSYREFFELFLEKSVSTGFNFGHPDFSNIMECKKNIDSMLPGNLDSIIDRKQVEEFKRIESMLGSIAPEFTSYIKLIHEKPSTGKRWKGGLKKRPSKSKFDSKYCSTSTDRFDIGGREYEEEEIPPDILNAMQKEEELNILIGLSSPKPKAKVASASNYYVNLVSKVKVKLENETHSYTLLLFKKCLILTKVRNRSMKISRIIKLRSMWVSEALQLGDHYMEENSLACGWLGIEGCIDEELFYRAVFTFPSRDLRTYWLLVLQRHLDSCYKLECPNKGVVQLYFKDNDSKTRAPCTDWQGMSCQDLQIDIKNSVDEVIEQAVTQCQMLDNSYSLTLVLLQGTHLVYGEPLWQQELPLLILLEIRNMLVDGSNMKVIFVLQQTAGPRSPQVPSPASNMFSTISTVFRKNSTTGSRSGLMRSLHSSSLVYEPVTESASTNKLLGVSVDELMQEEEELPVGLAELMCYLYYSCYNSEGIFRVPGSLTQQRAMEAKLNSGQRIDWSAEDIQDKFYLPNVAASLFKSFLRSLPDGMFPRKLFPEFEVWRESWQENWAEPAAGISSISVILSKIPHRNMTLIRHTIYILKRVSDYSTVNLMELGTLATCIGPSLISWPEDGSALAILADRHRRETPSIVTQFIVCHASQLLGPEPPLFCNAVEEDVVSRRSKNMEVSDEEESVWMQMMRNSVKDCSSSSSSSSNLSIKASLVAL